MDDAILVPTPDELPELNLRFQIPDEALVHSSVEVAIAQNEDLMARLKVALRRLTLAEQESFELKKALVDAQRQQQKGSHSREIAAQREQDLREQIKALETRIVSQKSMAKEIADLKSTISRHKKYQEKIRTQIKPYVQNLRVYSNSLLKEIQGLHSELREREAETAEINEAFTQLANERRMVEEQLQAEVSHLTSDYEKNLRLLKDEVSLLRGENARLELAAQKYDEMRLREDELENVIIALRREKEQSLSELRTREQDLLKELSMSRQQAIDFRLKAESLDETLRAERDQTARWESQSKTLEEQLATLRFLWQTQNHDLEKQKQSIESLEKLNAELSRQLQRLTTSQA